MIILHFHLQPQFKMNYFIYTSHQYVNNLTKIELPLTGKQTWKKSWNIHKGDYWNVERITETNKTGSLNGCIDIQAAYKGGEEKYT